MNELLFECYSIPKVCYGIDSLLSLRHNLGGGPFSADTTALVVSCGFHSVHIVPVIRGEVSPEGIRRINIGGWQVLGFLQRNLQLKYPAHANSVTVRRR